MRMTNKHFPRYKSTTVTEERGREKNLQEFRKETLLEKTDVDKVAWVILSKPDNHALHIKSNKNREKFTLNLMINMSV